MRGARAMALVAALGGLAACTSDEPPSFVYGPPTYQARRGPPPLPPRRPQSAPLAPKAAPPPTRPTPPGLALLAPPHARLYRVREGETVYGIARRFGVDMGALVRMNHMAPPYRINAGESLLVPRPAPAPNGTAVASLPSAPMPPAAPDATSGAAPPPPLPRPVALTPPAAAPMNIAPPPRAGSGFEWPVRGHILAPFGKQPDGLRNDGINIAAKEGTPVRAADNGVVVYAGNELPGFGNLLILRHAGGWMTAYAHNSSIGVRPGETVRRGQVVATVGHTGGVSRPQLHFEIRRKGGAVDPAHYLTRTGA